MKFIENGKILDYPCDNKHYLKDGEEVNAYLIQDEVVKVFHSFDTKRERISIDLCDELSQIQTKRILLPTQTLLDEHSKRLKAYKMRYIKNLGKDSLFLLSKKALSKEMEILKEDLQLLSNHGILINDLDASDDNISFHNGLYLIDPGSYIKINVKKKQQKAYQKNINQINALLLRLMRQKAIELSKDEEKADLMIKDFKKSVYRNKIDPLDYFIKGIEGSNLLDFIQLEMEKLNCKISINGQNVDLEKDYRRVFFDDKKEIYHSKKDNKVLYLYKTEKCDLKLTKKELEKLTTVSTKRIITPDDHIETSRDDYRAFQVVSHKNYPNRLLEISGKDANMEFQLLKKDAISLAKEGIYIGKITEDNTLYERGIYIQCIESFEKVDSKSIEKENITSINDFLSDLILNELYEITSLRTVCKVMNSLKENSSDQFLADTIKEELGNAPTLKEGIRTMIKTRGV